ncbi:MAG: hypothetical protein WCW03_03845 [Candidatus Paceibacterota bacterium]|jgi:uncharacterized tellurite resistance protein B-like protein
MANERKTAKDFVHETSNIDRHAFDGRRHSFISMIFAAVNDDATLSGLQQNVCSKRINEVDIVNSSEGELTEVALNIATFINTCH